MHIDTYDDAGYRHIKIRDDQIPKNRRLVKKRWRDRSIEYDDAGVTSRLEMTKSQSFATLFKRWLIAQQYLRNRFNPLSKLIQRVARFASLDHTYIHT